jgi:N-acetylglucosamine kinase-like BadF-type ATPase
VDGVQSSTSALIGDESGRILGGGEGGPSNQAGAEGGREKFVGAIEGCVGAACQPAGLDPTAVRFEAACLGFSGGLADKEPILGQLLRSDRRMVTSDAFIALSGATAGGPGIVAIAGTGSIASGRNAAGRTARTGGWGYLFGDESGAFSIVRQALLEATGAASANDLLHRFYTAGFARPRIASYARLVGEVARQGDPVALEILREAAHQLVAITLAVRDQLFRARTPVRAS